MYCFNLVSGIGTIFIILNSFWNLVQRINRSSVADSPKEPYTSRVKFVIQTICRLGKQPLHKREKVTFHAADIRENAWDGVTGCIEITVPFYTLLFCCVTGPQLAAWKLHGQGNKVSITCMKNEMYTRSLFCVIFILERHADLIRTENVSASECLIFFHNSDRNMDKTYPISEFH